VSAGALARAAIVFDLDGTLVDSRLDFAALREEIRALLAARGIPWSGERGHEPALAELLTWARDHESVAAPAVYADAMARVEAAERVGHSGQAMPDATRVLRRLRAAGAAVGVLTNNARAGSLAQMGRLGLDALVDVVVTRDDVPALKPDPRGLRMTFEHLGAERSRWFIGDSWIDAAAAQALGVAFVALRLGPELIGQHGLRPVLWHAASLDEAADVVERAAEAARGRGPVTGTGEG
jgi:phosphoglycolate phosphatase